MGLVVMVGCSNGSNVPAGGDAPLVPPPAVPAALSLTPQTADLGTVNACLTTAPAIFTITNTGGSTSGTISAITTGADAAAFNVMSSTCTTLAAAGTCTVNVTFTSSMPGAHTASLVVSASPGGAVMATLDAAGVSFGALAISPSTFAFPDQAVNTTGASTQVFTITNGGCVTTGVFSVTPGGSDPIQFVKTADSCSGVTLAPSTSCSFTIAFHPTTTGAKTASFVVTGNPGGEVSAAVSGNGTSSTGIVVAPSAQDFGAIPLCSSATHTFTLTNTDVVATGVLATPTLGGVDAAQFTIVSETCTGTTLLPNSGNSCSAVVRYDPASASAVAATLSAMASPGGTAVVLLSGAGLADSGFRIAPVTHDFGTVAVGSASAATSITVTNVCKTATATLSTALAGANPGAFTLVAGQNTCQGAVLAPLTGSCTMAVAFSPSSTGMQAAALTVSNNVQDTTAGLSGTGI